MIERGTLVDVEVRPEGSSLTADVLVGATTLNVKQVGDFTGTLLELGDEPYSYTVSESGDLLLATGLVAPASEGDPVLSLNDLGKSEARWIANVRLSDDDDEPIEATIGTAERGYFEPGDRDAGALVEVESVGEGYRVRTRPVDPANLDQAVIDVPFITLYLASNVSWPDGTTLTPITGWSTQSAEAGAFSLASGVITFNEPGLYLFTLAANWAGNTSGRRYIQLVTTIGGVDSILRTIPGAPPDGLTFTQQIVVAYQAQAGETLRAEAQQTSGAALSLRGDAAGRLTALQIVRLQA